MDSAEILLKEYETLRQEVMVAMGSRNSILSFGLATMGAIFTASVATQTGESPSPFASLILSIIVPLISVFVLYMWLGEYQRMQRAGKFIAGLEKRINTEKNKELLSWETSLRKGKKHMKYPYNTTVLLLMIISCTSLLIGVLTSEMNAVYLWIFASLGVGIHIALYASSVSKIETLRQ